MGKSYSGELAHLPQTYSWSLEHPITDLVGFIQNAQRFPLITVGSGGSLTAAHLAALLHQQAGAFAKSTTPFGLAGENGALREASVLILTAGGSNPDVLDAFRLAVAAEPRQLVAICTRTQSKLASLAREFSFPQVVDFDLPCGKDGFLATNSLLASAALLIRAYHQVFPPETPLPPFLPGDAGPPDGMLEKSRGLLERDTWVVLHGRWGLPAAADLESKLTEAALVNVQMADYRNFAHGRHHWLAKRGATTGVVALVTPTDAAIADKTLQLLPPSIPILRLATETSGAAGALDLLVRVLHLVQLAGSAKRVDPGNPGVPEFGRRIYHLRTPANHSRALLKSGHEASRASAIARKIKAADVSTRLSASSVLLGRAYDRFLLSLAQAEFTSVVFDYDGTLCDASERLNGPSEAIVRRLTELLDAGLVLGVATGRGKSVRAALQRAVPERYWDRFLVGYYNGAEVGTLGEHNRPDTASPPHPALAPVKESLEANSLLCQMARFDARPRQITVTPTDMVCWDLVRETVFDIAANAGETGIRAVESSHSIDIIAAGVSKVTLLAGCKQLCSKLANEGDTLCIGDKGRWPGNDHALLATPYSLSVDAVSPALETCWNIAPAGYRGMQATLTYLNHLHLTARSARYRT